MTRPPPGMYQARIWSWYRDTSTIIVIAVRPFSPHEAVHGAVVAVKHCRYPTVRQIVGNIRRSSKKRSIRTHQRAARIIGQPYSSRNSVRSWVGTKIVVERMVLLNDKDKVFDWDPCLALSNRARQIEKDSKEKRQRGFLTLHIESRDFVTVILPVEAHLFPGACRYRARSHFSICFARENFSAYRRVKIHYKILSPASINFIKGLLPLLCHSQSRRLFPPLSEF